MSKEHRPDKFWISEEYTFSSTSFVNVPIPQGYWIDRITVDQGSTNLGASATMVATLPEGGNVKIATLDADADQVYCPAIAMYGTDGTAISGAGVAVRLYTDDGITITVGGTVASGGTATVRVYATSYYPYGYGQI